MRLHELFTINNQWLHNTELTVITDKETYVSAIEDIPGSDFESEVGWFNGNRVRLISNVPAYNPFKANIGR